jgi:reactive intermediate/imine deaminase
MPEKTVITSEQIPAAFGHYSQAVKYENAIYLSALYPLDPKTGQLVGAEAAEQCEQLFKNMTQILQSSGAQLSNILMMHVYLVDYRDIPALETISKKYFFFIPPARSIVPVPWLPYGARMAFDAVLQIIPAEVKGGLLF